MTAAWLDFWNGSDATYVNARHKDVHYRLIAKDIAALVPFPQARVLDYGCGDALHADIVAAAAAQLVLCEAAPRIRARLTGRFGAGQNPKIRVLTPEEMERLPGQSFDLIILHSVIQYLTGNETEALFAEFHRLLQRSGLLIVGDVIPQDSRALSDALALLRLAAANRFLVATVAGLIRLSLSDYRSLRGRLGLARYEESEIIRMLGAAGFAVRRAGRNIGHDQGRLAFVASPRGD
jgi:ubiquinone/menaquinone biosynthesis C-methylase UbiE